MHRSKPDSSVRFTHVIVFVVTNIVVTFLFSSLLRAFGLFDGAAAPAAMLVPPSVD